jgi:hypothetical protein
MSDQVRFARLARLGGSGVMAWLALAATAFAQLPKPMKESDLKAAGARQLSGPEIRKLLIGNTSYVVLLKNLGPGNTGNVIANYYRDDRVRVQKFERGGKTESNWWIDGNSRCVEERVAVQGHLCSTVWDLAGTLYLCLQPAGDCPMSFRNAPGNPEGL